MEEHNLELFIVTDNNDDLTFFAYRIMNALLGVFQNYTVETRRLYLAGEEKFNCKKLLFITWGFSEFTKLRVTELLKKLSITKERRYLLTVTGDSYGKSLFTLDYNNNEFCEQNILKVAHLKHIEKWWPLVFQFLFNVSIPKEGIYKFHLISRHLSRHESTVRKCLEYFNISRSCELLPSWRGCNIGLVQNLPEANEADRNTIYLSENATLTTPKLNNQYNAGQILTFLTQVYVRSGVLNGSFWNLFITLMRSISEFLSLLCLVLGVFGALGIPILAIIGFPIAGTVLTFQVLQPLEWIGLFVLCIIHTVMALISVPFIFILCYHSDDKKEHVKKIKYSIGAVFHLIAGLTNIVIMILIIVVAKFPTVEKRYDKASQAFVMFTMDLIFHWLWVLCIWCCIERAE